MIEVTLSVDIHQFFLSKTQPQFSTNPSHLTFYHRGLLFPTYTHRNSTSYLPSTFPPHKTFLDHSSPPSFLLSTTLVLIPITSPSDITSLLPTLLPSVLLVVSPYPGPELSILPTQLTPKETPDKTSPGSSSTPGLLISATPNVMPTLLRQDLVL